MSEFYTFEDPPPPPRRISDENNLYGEGWVARRTAAGCTLGWDGGDLVSKSVEVSITEEEFERLRREPSSFTEIQFKYDPYR